MKQRKPVSVEKAQEINIDVKHYVIGIYPNAVCLKLTYTDNSHHYQISDHENGNNWVGYSPKSQPKAWENAWSVITRKMMKKLEW